MRQNNGDYKPMPVDTSHVELPEELGRLAEMIAKNVHEVWAEGRMKDGWTYGRMMPKGNIPVWCPTRN